MRRRPADRLLPFPRETGQLSWRQCRRRRSSTVNPALTRPRRISGYVRLGAACGFSGKGRVIVPTVAGTRLIAAETAGSGPATTVLVLTGAGIALAVLAVVIVVRYLNTRADREEHRDPYHTSDGHTHGDL